VRRFLVGAEIALAVVLACAAGVVGKALHRFRSIDLGYDSQQVVMARPGYGSLRYAHDRQLVLAEAVRSRLRGAGGIAEASYWRRVPQPWPPLPQERLFAIEGRARVTPELYQYYEVGPRFLETLGAPLVEGRNFDIRDQRGSLPVAIVNRVAAESWWPGQSAVGKRVSLSPSGSAEWLTVIGVADVIGLDPTFDRTQIARQRARPQLFVPASQAGPAKTPFWNWGSDCFICPQIAIGARPVAETGVARSHLQNSILALEPNLPVNTPRTLYDEQVTDYTGETLRTIVRVVGGLAAISGLVALLGIYGVVASEVAGRVRELAIRQALGAGRWRLLRMMFKETSLLAVVAVTTGGCLYVVVERLAGQLIFGNNRNLLLNVSAIDARVIVPMLLAGLVVVLIAVAAGSRRALRLDPREGLKA
jgi:putative ABC transport system permease protein